MSRPAVSASDAPIAIEILNLFVADTPPLLVYPPDLERLLGCNRSAAYRACEQMAEAGWLARCRLVNAVAYRLGPKVERLVAGLIGGAMREHDLALETLAGIRDVLNQAERVRVETDQARRELTNRTSPEETAA